MNKNKTVMYLLLILRFCQVNCCCSSWQEENNYHFILINMPGYTNYFCFAFFSEAENVTSVKNDGFNGSFIMLMKVL